MGGGTEGRHLSRSQSAPQVTKWSTQGRDVGRKEERSMLRGSARAVRLRPPGTLHRWTD